jgi:hypothetical protein
MTDNETFNPLKNEKQEVLFSSKHISDPKINPELKNSYSKNDQIKVKKIFKYIETIAEDFRIKKIKLIDDPEKEVMTIFLLLVYPDVSAFDRTYLEADIIENIYNFCENKNMINTLMKTAIFVMR